MKGLSFYSYLSPTWKTSNELSSLRSYYSIENPQEQLRAQIDISNTANLIHEIQLGYEAHLQQLEKNQQELIKYQDLQLYSLAKLRDDVIENTNYLSDILKSVGELNYIIDIRTSAILEQLIFSNVILRDLTKLVILPEQEKQRLFFFNKALEYLSQVGEKPNRYDEALDNLLKALDYDKNDYYTNYQLGLVYLYSPKYIDLKMANYYLSRAIEYGNCTGNKFCARGFYHLAYCQYLQANYDNAIINFNKAYKIDNDLIEAINIQAVCYSAINDVNNVLKNLKILADKDLNYLDQIKENYTIWKFTEVKDFVSNYLHNYSKNILGELFPYKNFKLYKSEISNIKKIASNENNVDDLLQSRKDLDKLLPNLIKEKKKQEENLEYYNEMHKIVVDNLYKVKLQSHKDDILHVAKHDPLQALSDIEYFMKIEKNDDSKIKAILISIVIGIFFGWIGSFEGCGIYCFIIIFIASIIYLWTRNVSKIYRGGNS